MWDQKKLIMREISMDRNDGYRFYWSIFLYIDRLTQVVFKKLNQAQCT